jgi:hypothetical protein
MVRTGGLCLDVRELLLQHRGSNNALIHLSNGVSNRTLNERVRRSDSSGRGRTCTDYEWDETVVRNASGQLAMMPKLLPIQQKYAALCPDVYESCLES